MWRNKILPSMISLVTIIPLIAWIILYIRGRQFALRDRLHKADAIIVLAGSRGNIAYLDGKICTAIKLYQQGWAPKIIASGKFSVKLTQTPTLIPLEELQMAVAKGRIQEKDVANAAKTWDTNLGAIYIKGQAIQAGIPKEAILVEDTSLHTRENAEYVLELLKQHDMTRVILITSPFHQLRTYLTFAKVFRPYNIEIINYYADTGEWHPATWFFTAEHRRLVKSEIERIKIYRKKGDLL
jgi:uncharacterized SAM-binding protein YcdF (DUF218 family)